MAPMPKRRIDPTTGDPELTDRELRFIDEYTNNGGNASQAAAPAGYGAARPGQSAYQVLRRPEVDRRILERIAQSLVSADEIIGTLASIMHVSTCHLYDESCELIILFAQQTRADHL